MSPSLHRITSRPQRARVVRAVLVGTAGTALAIGILPGVSSAAGAPLGPRALSLSGSGSAVGDRPVVQPATVPHRVIVRWRDGVSSTARLRLRAAYRVRLLKRLPLGGTEVLSVPTGASVAATMTALARDPQVASVQPDFHYAAQGTSCPPASGGDYFGCLWGLSNYGQNPEPPNPYASAGLTGVDINATKAWALPNGGGSPNVVVGVIDTGIYINHPDLAGRIWTNSAQGLIDDGNAGYVNDLHGWDFVNNDNSVYDNKTCPADPYGNVENEDLHGTHVAGTIAATNDSTGVVGVAYGVTVMPLKALGCNGGDTSTVIAALSYAKAHGVKIVNMSLGGPDYDAALKAAIDSSGILVVAAAGNGDANGVGYSNDATSGANSPFYPASFTSSNIISVASVNNHGALSSFSNFGRTSVDVSAPGESVLSTMPPVVDSGKTYLYAWLDGTSMATPHVTGVAALVESNTGAGAVGTSPTAVKARILSTTAPMASTAGRTFTGGIVDAAAAVSGVTTPLAPTATYLYSSSSRITNGQYVTLSARVKRNGSYLVGRSVALLRYVGGSNPWAQVCTATTGSSTFASCRVKPSTNTTYMWNFRGDPGLAPSWSSYPTVLVNASMSLQANTTSLPRGRYLSLTGRIWPNRSGVIVRIQEYRSGAWGTHVLRRTASDGSYRYVERPSAGTHIYRVTWAGDSRNAASLSGSIRVTVR